jgi:large subunit ribosomal protein L21
MEYGIIEASSRQYWIEQGKIIDVNNLLIKSGSTIFLNQILFGRNKDKIFIGQPYLTQIKVEASIEKHFLGPKILVYKMKPKKKYRRKIGHRQQLTRLVIHKISF